MTNFDNGMQQPMELDISGQVHEYNPQTEGEFFKLLEKYTGYKIQVEYYTPENKFIKTTSHIIKDVRPNAIGVMSLKLD